MRNFHFWFLPGAQKCCVLKLPIIIIIITTSNIIIIIVIIINPLTPQMP